MLAAYRCKIFLPRASVWTTYLWVNEEALASSLTSIKFDLFIRKRYDVLELVAIFAR